MRGSFFITPIWGWGWWTWWWSCASCDNASRLWWFWPSYYLNRANHTWTQPISSIAWLQAALDWKASINHDHNMLYYTKEEINNALSNKADINHDHNQLYYTKLQVDNLLSNKANINHNHDNIYYKKNEVDSLLEWKANVNHNHTVNDISWFVSWVYNTLKNSILEAWNNVNIQYNDENNKITITAIWWWEWWTSTNALTLWWQPPSYYLNRANHTWTQPISTIEWLEEALDSKAPVNHNHNNLYYTKDQVDAFLAWKVSNTFVWVPHWVASLDANWKLPATQLTEHNHNDLYYTKEEVNALLQTWSDHNHDDRYYTKTEINSMMASKANIQHSHSINDIINFTTEVNNLIAAFISNWWFILDWWNALW